jgi:Ulp1 family protease
MFSRVKKACRFRCMPLSAPVDVKKRLKNLRPNIFATRYRMDISKSGFWDPTNSEREAAQQERSTVHRSQPKAALARQAKRKIETTQDQVDMTVETSKKRKHIQENNQAAQSSSIISKRGVEHQSRPTVSFVLTTPTMNSQNRAQTVNLTNQENTEMVSRVSNPLAAATVTPTPAAVEQSFIMKMSNGVPLGHNRFKTMSFKTEGLQSLLPQEWVNDEPVDLFSILETRDIADIYYVPVFAYSHYSFRYELDDPHERAERQRNVYRPGQCRHEMINKKLWIAAVNNGNHWQMMCFVNPGPQNCFVILLDSLVTGTSVTDRPSNYNMCCIFARALLRQVYSTNPTDNLYRGIGEPQVDIGLVRKQPNYTDCGVYAFLSLKHAVENRELLYNLQRSPTGYNFIDWYTVQDAENCRRDMYDHYKALLQLYGVPEATTAWFDDDSSLEYH